MRCKTSCRTSLVPWCVVVGGVLGHSKFWNIYSANGFVIISYNQHFQYVIQNRWWMKKETERYTCIHSPHTPKKREPNTPLPWEYTMWRLLWSIFISITYDPKSHTSSARIEIDRISADLINALPKSPLFPPPLPIASSVARYGKNILRAEINSLKIETDERKKTRRKCHNSSKNNTWQKL